MSFSNITINSAANTGPSMSTSSRFVGAAGATCHPDRSPSAIHPFPPLPFLPFREGCARAIRDLDFR
ncbi:hypothetical protein EVAR_103535_1 [Eumeta japonica]|uniref:Uncharacterized protein n=1 Tax=Eumeta variegata TaxID=151549 RepID=A0A4C1YIS5_EUMVA|nr:hypothetical protein EVAR_103535_1 [Eumeta japonica]